MIMQWDLEGLKIKGTYLYEFPVTGLVESSRIAYGGDIHHTVILDNAIEVYGAIRDRVILNHKQIESVSSN